MKNPNNRPLHSEQGDSIDAVAESAGLNSEAATPKPRSLFRLNQDMLKSILNPKKEERALNNPEQKDEEDSENLKKRRKKTAGTLKGLFKRKKFVSTTASQPAEPTEKESAPSLDSENIIDRLSRSRPDSEEAKPVPSANPVNDALVTETVSSPQEVQPNETLKEEIPYPPGPTEETRPPEDPPAYEMPKPLEEPTATIPQPSQSAYRYAAAPAAVPSANAAPPAPDLEPYLPLSAAANINKYQVPGKIERRGGIAGPLTAFLAANYLSRRRHRRARKELDKVKKKLEEVDKKRTAKKQELQESRKDLQQPMNQNIKPKSVARAEEIKPEKVKEPSKELAKPVSIKEVIAKKQAQKEENKPVLKLEEKTPTVVKNAPKPISKEKLEAAQKPNIVKESIPAKPAESKPEAHPFIPPQIKSKEAPPTVNKEVVPKIDSVESKFGTKAKTPQNTSQYYSSKSPNSSSGGQGGVTDSVPPHKAPPQPKSVKSAPVQPSDADIYKKSIKNGIGLGIAIVTLGIIAYLVMS